VAPTGLTREQEDRLDLEARKLLDDARLGPTIRAACGASACGRRDRGRALYALDAMIRTAFAEPVLAEALTRAVGLAWREKLDVLTGRALTSEGLRERAFNSNTPKEGGNDEAE
jgi:hypothetical protein